MSMLKKKVFFSLEFWLTSDISADTKACNQNGNTEERIKILPVNSNWKRKENISN